MLLLLQCASHFMAKFHDLLTADSLIKQSNIVAKEGEDGLPFYALANFATQQNTVLKKLRLCFSCKCR